MLVTPVQMADYMAALANGGTVYRPRLVKEIEDTDGKVIKEIPVDVDRTVTLDSPFMANLKAAMINVVDDGTATVVHRDDMKIAAKTGTAQVGTKDQAAAGRVALRLFPSRQSEVRLRGDDPGRGLGQSRPGPGRRSARRSSKAARSQAHILDDMYGPPPNAKERSERISTITTRRPSPSRRQLADKDKPDDDDSSSVSGGEGEARAHAAKSTGRSRRSDSEATGLGARLPIPAAKPRRPSRETNGH